MCDVAVTAVRRTRDQVTAVSAGITYRTCTFFRKVIVALLPLYSIVGAAIIRMLAISSMHYGKSRRDRSRLVIYNLCCGKHSSTQRKEGEVSSKDEHFSRGSLESMCIGRHNRQSGHSKS